MGIERRTMASAVRQNYHNESEALINKQINMELYASYVYMAMGHFFSREDQALHGFSKFFKKNSDEERDHAQKFMDYQNHRGGTILLKDISKPRKETWNTILEAVEDALALEKEVNKSLLCMHDKAIKELADLVTKTKRVGDGLGRHLMDKDM